MTFRRKRMESTHTVSSYLIQKLHEYGIRHIFGVPGDYILGFYDELIRSRMLNVVKTSDEQGRHLQQMPMHG